MKIQIGEFRGHPFLTLQEGDEGKGTKLNFGVKKAKMILAAMEHIKDFVTKYDKPDIQQPPVLTTIAEIKLAEEN